MKRIVTLFVSLFMLSAIVYSPAAALTVDDIGREVICMCGCNQLLNNCNHGTCGVRDQMRATAELMIAGGKTKPEIIQSFVDQYGELVLSVPTKKGFNLAAWITPFAALAAGGALIYVVLRLWVLKGKEEEAVESVPTKRDDEYRSKLEEELKKHKGGFA